MHRRIHIDNLRTSDPATVAVLAGDALRRPLRQIGAPTLTDLLALSEVDGLPKPLSRDLGAFAERIGNEIADLPNGPEYKGFVDELGELPPEKVPACLRGMLQADADRDARENGDKALATARLEAWASVEPEAVTLPEEPTAEVETAPAKKPAPRRRAARRTATPAPTPEDAERTTRLRQLILERLSGYGESGLKEAVLLAGLMHRGRQEFPDLVPHEILGVLKDLKATGQLKQSAGRWKLQSRW